MSYSSMESEEQERKLFVGGLNKAQTDEDSLKSFFLKYGAIIDCTIMRDNEKQSRGFGFVLFESSSSVDEIINVRKEGKNFTLDDHHIEVKRALPKVPGGTAGSSRTGGLYRKIFVGGLPSTISDDELRKYFERFGRVTETELLRDRETNRLRGFAFVTFDDEDSADKCIQRRTHEICKKICEVKRAQTRSTINKYEEDEYRGGGGGGGRFGRDRDDRHHHHHQGPQTPSSLGINEVNQLIQQAFLMGQQSVMNSGVVQPPTAASLLNQINPASYAPQNAANPLLQALMNQHAVPAQQAPIQPPMAQPSMQQPNVAQNGNTNQLANQIAQLLQGRGGIDPNALTSLIKQDDNRQPQSVKPASNGAYSTAYPTSSTYDMYYNQSNTNQQNYGPTKEDPDSKRYRPY